MTESLMASYRGAKMEAGAKAGRKWRRGGERESCGPYGRRLERASWESKGGGIACAQSPAAEPDLDGVRGGADGGTALVRGSRLLALRPQLSAQPRLERGPGQRTVHRQPLSTSVVVVHPSSRAVIGWSPDVRDARARREDAFSLSFALCPVPSLLSLSH